MTDDTSTNRTAVITGASSGLGSATARALVADGHRDALVAAADRVRSELDGAGILVNNAEVNLLGAIVATEVFLDQLRERGGDLVNVSSVAGRTARAGNVVYAATKWGALGSRGRRVRSFCLTSASRSSSLVRWQPN